MLRTRTIVLPAVLSSALIAGSAGFAHAAATEDVSALKEQIAQLQAKVVELEKKLANKPAATAVAASPVMDEDFPDPFDQISDADRMMQAMMSRSMMPMHQMMNARQAAFAPDYDIKSTDKGYLISFDMPGMDKSKINVEVKNGALLVSGERSSETKEDQGGRFYRQQRSFGYFSRVIPLPQDVKPETMQAKYENGVLTVTVDKKEPGKNLQDKQKIEVK